MDNTGAHQVPEDYFTALNDAMEAAQKHPVVELDTKMQLYMFEFGEIRQGGQQPLRHRGMTGDTNP